MTPNALFSDVVLPAATWYEKVDLSSTDLHPFVHTFNAAIPPPWEAKTDWDAFRLVAAEFSRLAEKHLGVRRDLVAAPLLHDSADEVAQPFGEVKDWRAGECEPLPGKTMPKLLVVERDYPAVAAKHGALGPLVEQLGLSNKGASWKPLEEVRELGAATGSSAGDRRTAARRWSGSSTPARRSWRCRARRTAGLRSRASARSSSAPASRWPTSPSRGPTTGSRSPTPRCSRGR